jgi:Zn finger protein HypA/HybF involved in hydrogenase expression
MQDFTVLNAQDLQEKRTRIDIKCVVHPSHSCIIVTAKKTLRYCPYCGSTNIKITRNSAA